MRRERKKSKNPGGRSTARINPRRIALTRPVGKGEDTAEFVKSLGWTPFVFHTVELKPLGESQVKDQLESSLNDPIDWIVFMSSSGADLLFEMIMSHAKMRDSYHKTDLLAVGPKTRETLIRHGATQVAVPNRYSSEGIEDFFSQLNPDVVNLRIVLVRSSSADDSLARTLATRGALVTTINAYESALPRDFESTFTFLEDLSNGKISAVLFTSAISVSNFFKIARLRFDESHVMNLLKRLPVGAIGPVTADELRRWKLDPIVPDEFLLHTAVKKLVDLVDSPALFAAS